MESGNAADLRTMRNKNTGELVSAKWVQRESGVALGRQTEREIINHRKLLHPNIIRLLEVQNFCETGCFMLLAASWQVSQMEREIVKHRKLLLHPNIIRLLEVQLAPVRLAVLLCFAPVTDGWGA